MKSRRGLVAGSGDIGSRQTRAARGSEGFHAGRSSVLAAPSHGRYVRRSPYPADSCSCRRCRDLKTPSYPHRLYRTMTVDISETTLPT